MGFLVRRSTCAGVTLLLCLVGTTSPAETVVEETFESDPKWETKGMEGYSAFGWNSALKNVALPGDQADDGKFVRRKGWDAYFKELKAPITDKTSFTLQGDLTMTSEEPYARIYLGLFDQTATAAEERNALYIERSRNPKQHYLKIYAVDGSGAQRLETKYFGLPKDATAAQTVEVDYDASNRTLSWKVNGKPVDTLTLPADFLFSTNICGVSNARWSSGATDYVATGTVDNISLRLNSPSVP